MAKWNRELVIREILRRNAEGLALTAGRDRDVDWSLYEAGSRIFGSWRNAVAAAGLRPEALMAYDRWPPAKILTAIRALGRRKVPLRTEEILRRYGYLAAAARRVFGSWSKAIIAAGVDPQRLRRVPPWTGERIVEEILKRALRNEPLRGRAVEPRSLVEAAARIFGSWAAALVAAGVDPDRLATRAAPDSVPAGAPPTHTHDRPTPVTRDQHSDPAERRPGHPWTNERLKDAILSRLHQGRPINAVAVIREDTALYRAASRRHGSWRGALLAAGLNPNEHRRYGGRRRHPPEP